MEKSANDGTSNIVEKPGQEQVKLLKHINHVWLDLINGTCKHILVDQLNAAPTAKIDHTEKQNNLISMLVNARNLGYLFGDHLNPLTINVSSAEFPKMNSYLVKSFKFYLPHYAAQVSNQQLLTNTFKHKVDINKTIERKDSNFPQVSLIGEKQDKSIGIEEIILHNIEQNNCTENALNCLKTLHNQQIENAVTEYLNSQKKPNTPTAKFLE
jgi:hypothetical protein